MTKSFIVTTGAYLPKKIMTNGEISKIVDTSDAWIVERTGILKRHIAEEHETTSTMAINAALDALESAKKLSDQYNSIDGIIVATTTPDKTFPSVATQVQNALGIKQAFAFDIQAVCSGFIYALHIADAMLKAGEAKNILVIGADTMSRIVDWKDRSTCILFADGAGAALLSSIPYDSKKTSKSGIISKEIFSDGSLADILYTNGGVSTTQKSGHIIMKGTEVFKVAIDKMVESSKSVLSKAKIKSEDINWLVPHQANIRIMQAVAQQLEISKDKVIATVDSHANTSAATIPLAMNKYQNRFKRGDYMLLTAAGGGFTWGSMVLRW